MKLLLLCGALAAGEYAASLAPAFAEAWPVAAALAALTLLLGYGAAARGWPAPFFFLLGLALFYGASVADERRFRRTPWLRNRTTYAERPAQDPRLRALRRACARRLALGLPDGSATVGLSRAILLGERRQLPPAAKRLFVASGTMHVFAISGLHVMAVADVLVFLLGLLLVPRRLTGLVAIPPLWGYVALVGGPPSAVRAALMASFACLAPVCWRRPDGVRAWALAFLTIHLVSPQLVTDVGNALSFGVMLAIVLAGRLMRARPRWQQALVTTFAAWAAGVPIAAHVFGRVTPGALLANLVLLAAAKATVVAGAAGLLASTVSAGVAAHLNNLGMLAIQAMVLVAEAVSRLPGAGFETVRWSRAACLGWYAALALGAAVAARLAARRRAV